MEFIEIATKAAAVVVGGWCILSIQRLTKEIRRKANPPPLPSCRTVRGRVVKAGWVGVRVTTRDGEEYYSFSRCVNIPEAEVMAAAMVATTEEVLLYLDIEDRIVRFEAAAPLCEPPTAA